MGALTDDLLQLWLREAAEERRARAREARVATRQPASAYRRSANTLAEAHDEAAACYDAALDALHAGLPPTAEPACRVLDRRVELALTNGCAIVSYGNEHASGDDMIVLDATGRELGYWTAAEWAAAPEEVMGAILRCAALGCTPDTVAPPTLTPPARGQGD